MPLLICYLIFSMEIKYSGYIQKFFYLFNYIKDYSLSINLIYLKINFLFIINYRFYFKKFYTYHCMKCKMLNNFTLAKSQFKNNK